MGSCFADNIGRRMTNYGFRATVNPLGTTYNPASISRSLERISEGRTFTAEECVRIGAGDERICTYSHHTKCARASIEAFLTEANTILSEAHEAWSRADVLIITLGTAWVFRHKERDEIVTNCLKHPAQEFERYKLSVEETAEELTKIARIAEGRKMIITISPIRHMADGAHGNMVSKSTLQCATDIVINKNNGDIEYFPSYEIMMDELRDYRWYAEDMVHPTEQTESYIFERFMEFALKQEEKAKLDENIKKYKATMHRKMLS